MKTYQLPYIFDHHNHISYYLMLSSCANLSQVATKDEALKIMQALPQRPFTVVTGWPSQRFSFSQEELNQLPPLAIINFSLHGFVANRQAALILQEQGIEAHPKTKREAELAMPKLLQFFGRCPGSPLNKEAIAAKAKSYLKQLSQLGLYGACDMLQVLPEELALPSSLEGFAIMPYGAPQGQEELPPGRCWKLFADGAVGAKSAALSSGGLEDWESLLIYDEASLAKQLHACLVKGQEVAVHAIGDLALEQVVEAYAKLKAANLAGSGILRLEHCQFITLETAQKAKKLGLVLSMQPNFNEDSCIYKDRLSLERRQQNNPFRMLIDKVGFVPGQDLLFGSDGMPSGLIPALQSGLFPPYPEQALSLEEILVGYKADASQGTLNVAIDEEKRQVTLVDN